MNMTRMTLWFKNMSYRERFIFHVKDKLLPSSKMVFLILYSHVRKLAAHSGRR